MAEPSGSENTEIQLRKFCTDTKMEEGGVNKIKVHNTAAKAAPIDPNAEKRKWPALCDANPYIVDLLKNIFKKEEPPPPPTKKK